MISFMKRSHGTLWSLSHEQTTYTYMSRDYPKFLPLELPKTLLATDDFEEYQVYGEAAVDDWSMQVPRNNGAVRLGDNHRALIVATGHELHCLYRMISAMNYPDIPASAPEHSLHCLDYLRQSILCNADLTLERFDPLERVISQPKLGTVHVCRDWTVLFKSLEENFEEWIDFYSNSNT
ncbi:hypothetical protein SCHPADRAFT_125502 [Schizopora paradoxa]|uniref:Uncharacterized protein n=1 Tax=Schizopora paradoxa TaxID=27342 RepID=A0A0H2S2F8_9AGAM|nr:hypothetical protein SCHPADRAFT_125502 [Schizopora paradoxa]